MRQHSRCSLVQAQSSNTETKSVLQNVGLFSQLKFFNREQARDECLGTVVQRLDEINLETKVDLWRKILRPENVEVNPTNERINILLCLIEKTKYFVVFLFNSYFIRSMPKELRPT